MTAANDNSYDDPIDRTRKVWRPRLGRDLSDNETKQIAENVAGFFGILVEWSRTDQPEPANDNSDGATSDDEEGRHDR